MPKAITILAERRDPDCCLCTEFQTGKTPPFISGPTQIGNRVVHESTSFVAFPSLSPLRTGHVLISPKHHISSLAQLSEAHLPEFTRFVNSVTASITRLYGDVVLFEHGVGFTQHGGCGITHAHLHVLPLGLAALSALTTQVCREHGRPPLASFPNIILRTPPTQSYLILGSALTRLRQFVGSFPSQYLRRKLAPFYGLHNTDWRACFGWPEFIETHTALLQCQSSS